MFCTSSAPAKAILVGEHAVVYGQPAIAVPLLQLRAYVHARITALPLQVSTSHAGGAPFFWCKDESSSANPLKRAIELSARYFAVGSLQGELDIRSDVPIASGMGSGAAVSAALARGVAALLGRDIPDEELNAIVYEVEKLHHGTPSGIDNTVVVYERPIYFVKGRSTDLVKFSRPLTLVVADTGVPSPTRDAVADVRVRLKSQPSQTQEIFDRIGALVDRARISIETGEHGKLGELMTENHRLLQALDVSSSALDKLVEAALRAGAYGAKLSGGGRGGIMIALVSPDTEAPVAEALRRAGAKRVIVSSVGAKS